MLKIIYNLTCAKREMPPIESEIGRKVAYLYNNSCDYNKNYNAFINYNWFTNVDIYEMNNINKILNYYMGGKNILRQFPELKYMKNKILLQEILMPYVKELLNFYSFLVWYIGIVVLRRSNKEYDINNFIPANLLWNTCKHTESIFTSITAKMSNNSIKKFKKGKYWYVEVSVNDYWSYLGETYDVSQMVSKICKTLEDEDRISVSNAVCKFIIKNGIGKFAKYDSSYVIRK
jgi:hypothetical protein